MIKPSQFYDLLTTEGINFFTNVPDSLLKDILGYIQDNVPAKNRITAQNEGGAVAMAVGHYLATGQMSLVSLQNSGWGHALNPLLSLAKIYHIPMLLMIGWRGEPGVHDAVQHLIDGKLIKKLLTSAQVPFAILPKQPGKATLIVKKMCTAARKHHQPVALIIRKDTFENYKLKTQADNKFPLSREQAITLITKQFKSSDRVVATTGMASRELNEIVDKLKLPQKNFFYVVGSMGHSSLISLKLALEQPNKKIWCLDGDGALLMHMGSLPIIASQKPTNFVHIILNNGAHDSVGGQPTVAMQIDIPAIALASGYQHAFSVSTEKRLLSTLKKVANLSGPCLLEIKLHTGARSDLSRPKSDTEEIKQSFMSSFEKK